MNNANDLKKLEMIYESIYRTRILRQSYNNGQKDEDFTKSLKRYETEEDAIKDGWKPIDRGNSAIPIKYPDNVYFKKGITLKAYQLFNQPIR